MNNLISIEDKEKYENFQKFKKIFDTYESDLFLFKSLVSKPKESILNDKITLYGFRGIFQELYCEIKLLIRLYCENNKEFLFNDYDIFDKIYELNIVDNKEKLYSLLEMYNIIEENPYYYFEDNYNFDISDAEEIFNKIECFFENI